MLEFAIRYKKGVKAMTENLDNGLHQFELTKFEWKIAKQLCDIFKEATLFFCWGTPNLATVIPAMDHIDQVLASQCIDKDFLPPVCVALAMGKKTLNRYYNLTDASDVYRIAMVLHPRHKLKYFKHTKWEPSWIADALDIVQSEFDLSYMSVSGASDSGSTCNAETPVGHRKDTSYLCL
ncbi:hypothetical protein BV22DRAFT_1026834 [Leucogyrophana mollusca]|uniref:Uncharacterized protein n=1 Tax=Leucogyrophana mollusca TaxID=85980 RepID=A0ACB8AVA5_9AGAM|nr:hypothetical protein BV22DRAFT_1026834 [Leucogyrophana mollusca]